MVLAAGRGQRMRPLTDTLPKPMLSIHGKSMLARHLDALAASGVQHCVINTAWLEDKIVDGIGRQHAGIQIQYSQEGRDFGAALETAGGIARALPYLADAFWVLAGDVYIPDFTFAAQHLVRFKDSPALAHLFLVPNPEHNPKGDFPLRQVAANANTAHTEDSNSNSGSDNGTDTEPLYTFSTIALYKQDFFRAFCPAPHGNPEGQKLPIAPLLKKALAQGKVSTELYTGAWTDVGTPTRLEELNR